MIPKHTYAWGKCGKSQHSGALRRFLQSMHCLVRSADTDFDSEVQFLGFKLLHWMRIQVLGLHLVDGICRV